MRKLAFLAVPILCLSGIAYGDELPPNTIDCSQFKKIGDQWTEVGTAEFSIGTSKMKLSASPIPPHLFNYGGADLYEVLEKKCGST
jgi:hypothetical protein